MKISLISKLCGVEFVGPDNDIESVNLCNRYTSYKSILTYATSPKFCDSLLDNSSVKAVVLNRTTYTELLKRNIEKCESISFIVVNEPETVFYNIHEYLYNIGFYDKKVSAPIIGEGCRIHDTAVIYNGVVIGNHVTIGPGSVIHTGCIIKDDVEIGCNSVIGGHGFQALKHYPKIIHHIGGVIIHKGAYIGNLTTVSKAVFEGFTEIGEYSKLDDHVHFSHNCKCGNYCTLTAGTVLMGSVEIGDNVWISPSSLILNKKRIGNDSFIGSMSYVNTEVSPKSLMMGNPAKCYNKSKQ